MLKIATAIVLICVCIGCHESGRETVFHFNPSMPFSMNFGKGSSLDGLETIRIAENGSATLHRHLDKNMGTWKTANVSLTPELMSKLVQVIVADDLLSLKSVYSKRNRKDGSQWVLLIKQGEYTKRVYLDNDFPSQILRFDNALDDIATSAGVNQATWSAIEASQARKHESELWETVVR